MSNVEYPEVDRFEDWSAVEAGQLVIDAEFDQAAADFKEEISSDNAALVAPAVRNVDTLVAFVNGTRAAVRGEWEGSHES